MTSMPYAKETYITNFPLSVHTFLSEAQGNIGREREMYIICKKRPIYRSLFTYDIHAICKRDLHH